MKSALLVALLCSSLAICHAQSQQSLARLKAEYYAAAYAQHYRVPVALVRAIIERESSWYACTISPKGAVGLMQLMPATAQRLGVRGRCDPDQSVSGGVRYLAWLTSQFHDLRLVAAAYYAGEDIVRRRGLAYRNPDVVIYVTAIRSAYLRETASERTLQRDVR